MRYLLLIGLLLSSCASIAQKGSCDALIQAEEHRYSVCKDQLNQCFEARKQDSPPLLTKAIYGIIGLALGLIIGAKAVSH